MKRSFVIWFLLVALGVGHLPAEEGPQVSVVTRAELAPMGVTVRRLRHETPMASVTLEVTVVAKPETGRFVSVECRVLGVDVSGETLREVDASAGNGVVLVRATRSDKARSVFLIRGSELPRSYLAFEFVHASGDGAETIRRVLWPARTVANKRTPDPAERSEVHQ